MKVSVVILNWNGEALLRRFLGSVVQYSAGEGIEVVVADNGSTDGSLAYVRDTFPQVRILPLDRNYGFTGGYNRALAQLGSDYFLLLNSDVELRGRWIEPLLEAMEADPSMGAVMPKIRSQRDPRMFEYAGACGGFIDRLGFLFCRGRVLKTVEADEGQYDEQRDIFWASGAAMLVRADLYRRLGGLDEEFFAHMEEIDLCWRLQNAGYRIVAEPRSVVYHVGGATLDETSPFKLFLNFRNSLWMLYKNLPGRILFPTLLGRMTIDGALACIYLLQGKPRFFAAVIRAHFAFYRGLPQLRRKRRSLVHARRLPATVYRGLLLAAYASGKRTFRQIFAF